MKLIFLKICLFLTELVCFVSLMTAIVSIIAFIIVLTSSNEYVFEGFTLEDILITVCSIVIFVAFIFLSKYLDTIKTYAEYDKKFGKGRSKSIIDWVKMESYLYVLREEIKKKQQQDKNDSVLESNNE